ncbi:MAG: DUF2100 domain-containing protein [Promethearchaeota archaeon]
MVDSTDYQDFLNYTSKDHKKFINTIDDMVELRAYLRHYTPNFKIPYKDSKQILELFEKITQNIVDLADTLNIIDSKKINIKHPSKNVKLFNLGMEQTHVIDHNIEKESIQSPTKLLERLENSYVLVSSNSAKKKLKSMGILSQNIKSSGGPLFIEDYKKLKIALNEKAIEGIKKKLSKLFDDLEKINREGHQIYMVLAEDDLTDNINLQRASELLKKLKALKLIRIPSWDAF